MKTIFYYFLTIILIPIASIIISTATAAPCNPRFSHEKEYIKIDMLQVIKNTYICKRER